MTRFGWLSALLLTAAGLYFSRGLLDIVGGSEGAVRVAMLPPWWELALFVAVLGATALAASRANRDPDIALPFCALGLLVLPYLPWLPDRLPILRGLAGPARDLFWIVVFWLVASRACSGVRWPVTASAAPIAIFIASVAIFGAVAWRLTSTVQYPSGDEPHYLVITQSLLKDHDLRIENNHHREDYKAYFNLPLRPDYLTRGKDGQIYSIHPIGVAVLAVPAFALGGYRAVVGMLVGIAAWAATLLWRWTRETSGSASAATFAWSAVALTAPFVFNSFTVYPEIPGALAVLIVLAWRAESTTTSVLLVRGVALGALPWLSTKYAPMALAAGIVTLLRARLTGRALAAFLSPAAVLTVAWFAFFYWIWGTFSPSAPYGSSDSVTLRYLAHGGPGLLFDQEYGVVAYAPVLALAFVGFARMLRSGGSNARRALELLFVFGALVGTVGAFRLWWGGSAAPGRPVASGVLLLGVPIASLFSTTATRPSARAICQVLLASSLAIAFAMIATQDGALLRNDRDGAATILEWASPTWPLTSVFPSYIAQSLAGALGRTLAWLALGALVAWTTRLVAPRRLGAAALAAVVLGVGGAVALAASVRPADVSGAVDAEARSRAPLLDEFDAGRRPIAVLYDPLSRITPVAALQRVALVARPGQRTIRQPIDLLWNARFTLPAGRYRVEIERPAEISTADAIAGLQVGRVGPPLEQWTITGPAWTRDVVLPIDAALVGLRPLSSRGLEQGEFRLTPVQVVDLSRRVRRPTVFSATRYGTRTTFFHDDSTAGERQGYWTHGRATTQVTYVMDGAERPTFDVELRCGPAANHVTLSTPGWTEQLALEAGGSRRVAIPTRLQEDLNVRVAPLDITVRDGFVPAEVDRASTDRRLLGCWVEHLW